MKFVARVAALSSATTTTQADTGDRFLRTYLDDHVAGATLGLALVRRAQRENSGSDLGRTLRSLDQQLNQDRETLLAIRRTLGRPSLLKRIGALAAERIGRLKPNGQLRGYSPLSRLVELEALRAGIEGKRALWLSLKELGAHPAVRSVDLDELLRRADAQQEELEPHHRAAAQAALRHGG